MFGLQASLEVARRALRAHQLTLGVVGGNIANVDTPGYSRRRVELGPGRDIATPSGAVGAGIDVLGVTRARDRALDGLYRDHGREFGRWGAMQDTLARVEAAFPAGDDHGLGTALEDFWSSWHELANQPESRAARVAVRAKAQAVTDTFHRLDQHLATLAQGTDTAMVERIERVNVIAARVGRINDLVQATQIGGSEASGLLDERDQLLDELAQITDIQIDATPGGAVTVLLGAEVLVQGAHARALDAAVDPTAPPRIHWRDSGREPTFTGGVLSGLLEVRGERIASYRAALDEIAAALVRETNRVHTAGVGLDGVGGRAFFDPAATRAGSIAVDALIEADEGRIAASAGGGPGDGSQALALAQLASLRALATGTETLGGAYRQLVGRIGFEAGQAEAFRGAQDAMLAEIESQRSQTSGVSLDEEMTHMLSAQHAYQAMVRVTSTIDEMLDHLITRM